MCEREREREREGESKRVKKMPRRSSSLKLPSRTKRGESCFALRRSSLFSFFPSSVLP